MEPETRSAEAGFSQLVDRHARVLFRVAFSLLGNRQDAEDAVQEMFLKLFRTGAWRQPMADERAYLSRAVWRCGLDRRTTVEARAMRHAEDVMEVSLKSIALSPEQEAVAASDRALLGRLLQQLPDDLRQSLMLSAIDGMSGAEVAATLGVSEATVRTRVHRAKAELRRMFVAATEGVRR